MRTSLTLLLSLLLLSLASSAGRSQPRPVGKKKARPAVKAPEAPPKWEVKGRGEAQEEAEKDALEKALPLVTGYLRSRQPPLRRSPPLDYIREHFFGEPQRCEKDDEQIVTEKRVYTLQCWSWTVTIPPKEYRLLVQEDRLAKSGERMLLAGKVTGGLVLLLAALACYLRLEEWAQCPYNHWLRLALVSVPVSIAASLLLFA